MAVYMLKGDKKAMAIETRSGTVKELWDMVRPIIELEAKGDIGIDFFNNETDQERDRCGEGFGGNDRK